VRPLLGLPEAVLRAPADHVDLVVDPVADELVDGQRARYAVDQREHVGAEVGLQLGVLEQVVEDHAGDRVAPEDHDEALPGAVGGVVPDVGDALDLAGVGDAGGEADAEPDTKEAAVNARTRSGASIRSL
jgi:hypothetical protein